MLSLQDIISKSIMGQTPVQVATVMVHYTLRQENYTILYLQ